MSEVLENWRNGVWRPFIKIDPKNIFLYFNTAQHNDTKHTIYGLITYCFYQTLLLH